MIYKTPHSVRQQELFYYAMRKKRTMGECVEEFDRLQRKTYQFVKKSTVNELRAIYNGMYKTWDECSSHSFIYVEDPYNDRQCVHLRDSGYLVLAYANQN